MIPEGGNRKGTVARVQLPTGTPTAEPPLERSIPHEPTLRSMNRRIYHVYILSNRHRTVFYTGMTGNLAERLRAHRVGNGSRFASFYRGRDLIYHEAYDRPQEAIAREKELKGWRRSKKLDLVRRANPQLETLEIG